MTGVAELKPLGPGLSPEARALALELRRLFQALQVSVRRYAARRLRDAGTFSRYLNGTRVPPWEVVTDLFTDLAEHRGTAATPEAIELVRRLHRTALTTSAPSPRHAMEVLERQLADADRMSRRSSVRGDVLGEALLDRQHRIADLEVRISELEAAWSAERERSDRLAEAAPDVSELLREREALQGQVGQLAEELAATRLQRDRAEERCGLLERQLEAMEKVRSGNGLPTLVPPARPVGRTLPRVLIVDDQKDNLLAMTAVLATLEQELVAVSSGREALKALLDHDDFAVIIMDVQMPVMDGYETAAHIKRRSRSSNVPIIFLTAMGADPEHSARGYAAGAVDYIGKPFDPWVLRAKVAVFTGIYLERRARADAR